MSDTPPVRHDPDHRRFVIDFDDGSSAEARYERSGDVLVLTHTAVPREHEDQGHGTRLAETAFAHARKENLRVQPACAFMNAYAQRHDDVQDLLA